LSRETVTLVLAIWGAVLSTVLGLLAFVREKREDGRLRVRAYIGRSISGHSIQPFCVFQVVNVGRRPVYFKGLSLLDKKGKFITQVFGPEDVDGIDKIEPGDIRENVDPNFVSRDVNRLLRTYRVCAYDTRRERTYMPRWLVWRMHRQIRKVQAEHQVLHASEQQKALVRLSSETPRRRS
jgi:hypothetical protein